MAFKNFASKYNKRVLLFHVNKYMYEIINNQSLYLCEYFSFIILQISRMDKYPQSLASKPTTLFIQCSQNGLSAEKVQKHFYDHPISQLTDGFVLNSKDHCIQVNFHKFQQALKFYDEANFSQRILARPMNIWLDLQDRIREAKMYYFSGLSSQQNLFEMFKIVRQFAVCKIVAPYTNAQAQGKLKEDGNLILYKESNLSYEEESILKEKLGKINIRIFESIHERFLRYSVFINRFYQVPNDEKLIQTQTNAKNRVSQLIQDIIHRSDIVSIDIKVKKKNVQENQNQDQITGEARATIQFKNYEETISNFEKLRVGFEEKIWRVILHFHTDQVNSYRCLFTNGLHKPVQIKEKKFEGILMNAFKIVNRNVLQVLIFRVGYNDAYVGRVYMKDEESGKHFIADYKSKISQLLKFYKDKHKITFNINMDGQSMKKMKIAEGKKIKKDKPKKLDEKKIVQKPVNEVVFEAPKIQEFKFPPSRPIFKCSDKEIEQQERIRKLVRDRTHLEEMAKNSQYSNMVKQSLYPCVKYRLEENCIFESDFDLQTERILMKNEVRKVINFIANPIEQYWRVISDE